MPCAGGLRVYKMQRLAVPTAIHHVCGCCHLPTCCLPVRPCRCIAQLSVLGYILVPIFLANRWWITLLYALFMLGVAAVEAVSRPAQSYDGMLLQVRWGVGSGGVLARSCHPLFLTAADPAALH